MDDERDRRRARCWKRARLRLRPYRDDDAQAMFALYSDPRVMRYWSFPPWVEPGAGQRLPRARAGRHGLGRDIPVGDRRRAAATG